MGDTSLLDHAARSLALRPARCVCAARSAPSPLRLPPAACRRRAAGRSRVGSACGSCRAPRRGLPQSEVARPSDARDWASGIRPRSPPRRPRTARPGRACGARSRPRRKTPAGGDCPAARHGAVDPERRCERREAWVQAMPRRPKVERGGVPLAASPQQPARSCSTRSRRVPSVFLASKAPISRIPVSKPAGASSSPFPPPPNNTPTPKSRGGAGEIISPAFLVPSAYPALTSAARRSWALRWMV